MIKKENLQYIDTRTNESMKMVAFFYNPTTLEIYAYGSNNYCKKFQREKFIKEQVFYPIMQVAHINTYALQVIEKTLSFNGLFNSSGRLSHNYYYDNNDAQ